VAKSPKPKDAPTQLPPGQNDLAPFLISTEPRYFPVGPECDLFLAAVQKKLPVLLKGPTGCGKTRFLRHMAYRLNRPLITVACHEDLSGADLVGRFLLKGGDTVWQDGPLTMAARHGAICYLDELVEARKDTVVLIHPLTDDRRSLPLEKLGTMIPAHPDFLLVVSYNPGYQSLLKEMKPSTRQRFAAITFDFPPPGVEAKVVAAEAGIDSQLAQRLVDLAVRARGLVEYGLSEGVSTRLLVYAAQLMVQGIEPNLACNTALVGPATDDVDLSRALREIVADFFPPPGSA
jgi:nitric oxide reductase NorQ protein